jgi:16S rRNA (guanine1207-N2)-methyltransferase
VAGTNDEGGRSADSTLATLCSDVETVDARKHCRLYGGTWQDSAPLRASLADWAVEVPNPIGGADPWRAYPGVFAGGELDVGTRELLPVLPRLREGETALDFGAGIGVVSAQLLKRQPGAVIDMLEADAISLQAARHNVPSARPVLGDSFGALAGKRYHLIASNPPLHRGKAEHMGPLAHLVESAAAALRSRGEMLLVTQRQIPLGPLLERHFRFVRVERETTRFRVWKAA